MNSEPPHTRRAPARGEACVIVVLSAPEERISECERSLRDHTDAAVPSGRVAPQAAAINELLAQLAPADVVLLSEPCAVGPGWLERLRAAARADTNTATASALVDVGGPLALVRADRSQEEIVRPGPGGAHEHAPALRPRLNHPSGPCVYVRREALELVGNLDEQQLDLSSALEVDFAQRCVLSGLAHVAADDVVVQRLQELPPAAAGELPARLRERYPYLSTASAAASSPVLARALEEVRPRPSRLEVTIDARALGGTMTGTQVHILELVKALADTDALRLRLLVSAARLDAQTREALQALPETELLAEEDVQAGTPPSMLFHRPQQTFSSDDVALALRLGERVVVSQLDMIAYRNPGYFAGAREWEDFRRASRRGLAASERVVVFSEHTRGELISDALVEAERIRVVPPGLDHVLGAAQQRPEALERGAERFLLCLGTDFRHKNRPFALHLLASLRERHGWAGGLVLAGTHVEYGSSRELEQAILDEHPELREAVIDLGPVGEEEKAWLMAHAEVVLYPSVYEGFGLVPFEAALSGTPCLFAPQSSLAELVTPQTSTLVAWDVERSADVAFALLSDAAARAQHVDDLAHAGRKLTWAATAAGLVDVYMQAVSARVREAPTVVRDAGRRERELISDHDALVARLVQEREHARSMYDSLNTEVGDGLSLIGPHGSLPDDLQRALLAASARPRLSHPLFRAAAGVFRMLRAGARPLSALRRRT